MRNLREPLFTYGMYAEFSSLAGTFPLSLRPPWLLTEYDHQDETVVDLDDLKAMMKRLPQLNFNCLAVIFKLLAAVAAMSEVNMMGPSNLSKVWGPNLLSQDEEDPLTIVDEMARASRVVEAVIVHYDFIFPVSIPCTQLLST